jgi:hypothetical protein
MHRTFALLALLAGPAAAQTYTGTLAPGDSQLDGGEYYDQYTVEAAAGQWIEADLTAAAFDTYLIVAAPSGAQEDNDDFDGSQRRSHLRVQAQEGGTWRVVVTSYAGQETGDYQLSISVGGGKGATRPSSPAPGPATSAPAGLLGHWYSGSPSAIQYMDPTTGQYAPTSGTGTFLHLEPGGTYREGGILRTTTYSCTSVVHVDTEGRYSVSGNALVLNQTGGRSWGNVCGGQNYNRTLGAETKTYTFRLNGDTLERYLDGQPYDVMARSE